MLSNNIIDRIRLPFRKEKELYSSLQKIIGFYPRHIEYYKLALMHKSVAKRSEKGKPLNNERLEFLGDAILDAVVGDIVYRHFEGKREGFLTSTRSKLVQRETLNKLAEELGIDSLITSSGRSSSHNSYMGGNAFEALVGAIYLDRGYNACMLFMQKRILAKLINIDRVAYKEVNFKSKLLEWSQKNKVLLEYELVSQSKEKGSPTFVYKVRLEGLEGCTGKGYTKKESQQLASKETLQKLRREPQFIDAVFAAKGNRTKMEEEPVSIVPDTEEKRDFIIQGSADSQLRNQAPTATPKREPKEQAVAKRNAGNPENSQASRKAPTVPAQSQKEVNEPDEFDLSDITAKPVTKSREEIIAEAEAAAYQ